VQSPAYHLCLTAVDGAQGDGCRGRGKIDQCIIERDGDIDPGGSELSGVADGGVYREVLADGEVCAIGRRYDVDHKVCLVLLIHGDGGILYVLRQHWLTGVGVIASGDVHRDQCAA